jgi:hypothetical protein
VKVSNEYNVGAVGSYETASSSAAPAFDRLASGWIGLKGKWVPLKITMFIIIIIIVSASFVI